MVTLLGTACFNPDYGSPAFACGKGGQCPYGYECGSDGFCYREGTVPVDADDRPDAGPRDGIPGPPVDGRSCDGDCEPEPDAPTGADCPNERDGIVDITHSGGTYMGTTEGALDDMAPVGLCPLYTIVSTSPDVAHRFVLPGAAHVRFTVCDGAAWDTVLYLKSSCDDSTELVCDDDF